MLLSQANEGDSEAQYKLDLLQREAKISQIHELRGKPHFTVELVDAVSANGVNTDPPESASGTQNQYKSWVEEWKKLVEAHDPNATERSQRDAVLAWITEPPPDLPPPPALLPAQQPTEFKGPVAESVAIELLKWNPTTPSIDHWAEFFVALPDSTLRKFIQESTPKERLEVYKSLEDRRTDIFSCVDGKPRRSPEWTAKFDRVEWLKP